MSHRLAPVRSILLAVASLVASLAAPLPAAAYTYVVVKQEPLLDGREAMFQAAQSGFWLPVKLSLQSMQAEIDYLDQNEDPGIAADFAAALAAKNAEALRRAFLRAASAEILRRLTGAAENLQSYEDAKLMVVAANRFYTAIAGDLDPAAAAEIAALMPQALDAIGNPGVLGVGTKPADPAALQAAIAAISTALDRPAP